VVTACGTFVTLTYQKHYGVPSQHVPLGQSVSEFAKAHGWDDFMVDRVIEFGTDTLVTTFGFVSDSVKKVTGQVDEAKDQNEAKDQVETKGQELKVTKAIEETLKHVETIVPPLAKVEVPQPTAQSVSKPAEIPASTSSKVSADLEDLVARAEAAIAGTPDLGDSEHQLADEPRITPQAATPDSQISVMDLRVDFEPPPGFLSRQSFREAKVELAEETEKKQDTEPISLPLLTPTVSSLAQSEPIISHLTHIIDDLIPYLQSDPVVASKAADVLDSAQKDLKLLVDQFEKTREDERIALEAKLDEQSHEYSLKLLELELETRDRLDNQQEDFRKAFEEERGKIIQAYREKLENELKTQTDLINERYVCLILSLYFFSRYTRLKEEVIAQGIELQRRWIRDIKIRVEHERGGRLAKLDELSADLKRLGSVIHDNTSYLDDNIRVHALWSAIRALDSATQSSVRKPFREELRVLRHITVAREDPVVTAALDSLEKTDVPDVGVEPFADLSTWFINEVSPKVSEVALVPNENAGVLSYIASRIFSNLRFKRHGLVAGDDVLSVLARAEYYLNEQDLDSATRELNQLKGSAKVMLHDWLEAARRRLEVRQALEVNPSPCWSRHDPLTMPRSWKLKPSSRPYLSCSCYDSYRLRTCKLQNVLSVNLNTLDLIAGTRLINLAQS